VLQTAFGVAFQGRFALGARDLPGDGRRHPNLNSGAPFWALIAGTLVSLVMERTDSGQDPYDP
jgi:hypothetical protein